MFDTKELQILTQLRQDARMQLTEISRNTKIPISTIYDRLKNNKSGLMLKNVTLIDFHKLGFGCRVNMALKMKKKERDAVRDYLEKCFNINSLFKINNGYDFMIDAVFKNVKEVEEFIEKLEEKFPIGELKTYYVIDEISRERFLSDPLHIELLE
ncbi:MAG: Lrp/AsnC family transcriptional regulator [Nanoarchaeota archaeon]|nr:Lrp/AsnC family transcriptional regulator [Nanoarchaeota archaeon]